MDVLWWNLENYISPFSSPFICVYFLSICYTLEMPHLSLFNANDRLLVIFFIPLTLIKTINDACFLFNANGNRR